MPFQTPPPVSSNESLSPTWPVSPRRPRAAAPGRARVALALVAVAALTSGCGYVSQLRVDDTGTPVASLRATHRFSGGPGGGGIELDLQSARAEGRQGLDSLDTATLGGRSVSGPAVLSHQVKLQHLQLSYNHRLFAGAPVELEWFAGAALHRLDWRSTATPGALALDSRAQWWGPAGGAAGRLRLGAQLALELRYAGALEYAKLGGSRASLELALAYQPVPGLALRAGMADTRSQLQALDGDSDLVLRARGPFLGLALGF